MTSKKSRKSPLAVRPRRLGTTAARDRWTDGVALHEAAQNRYLNYALSVLVKDVSSLALWTLN